MNDTVQSMQIQTLLAKAAEERDEARNMAIMLSDALRHERKWNRFFAVLCVLLAVAVFMLASN